MKKWLVLGLGGLAVAWGPYVYSELTSSPVRSSGKDQVGPLHFGADEGEEDEVAEIEPEKLENEPVAEDPSAEKAASDTVPAESKADDKALEPAAAVAADKAADPHAAEAEDEIERPTLPSQLVPTFRKVFEAEPRDAFWANDEEPMVRALFKKASAPPDALSEVVCRKSVCRIGFTPDELEAEALVDLYTSLRARYGNSISLDAKPGAVGERATLYVLRPGYELEH